MATLQSLCSSAIENSGKDLKDVLNGTGKALPERMWERHPVLEIIFQNMTLANFICIDTKIRIGFSGIYTFELTREFTDEGGIHDHEIAYIREHSPELVPIQSKETFSQELSPQEEKEFEERISEEIEESLWSEQEIEAFRAEAHQEERGHLLINKILPLVADFVYICLTDPITGKEKLRLGYYENLQQVDMETIELQLRSSIGFIRSVSFC